MSPYEQIADLYDTIYSWKDYAGESRRLKILLRRAGLRRGATVLDVGCGTASHLVGLARWFDVTGIDASRRMLSRARQELPRVRWRWGRMETLRLSERFDAVLCLFSAIGYPRSVAEVRRTVRNLAEHLAPGGVLVIEPWIDPRRFRSRHVHLLPIDRRDLKIARVTVSRRVGHRSILQMDYLVGTPGTVRHLREVHRMTLVPTGRLRAWLREEGLRVRWFPKGLSGRGRFVGYRPAAGPPR